MTDLIKIGGGYSVGLPMNLADGSRFVVPAVVLINASGAPVDAQGGTELDTFGNIVPVYKGHAYTYDDNGNLATDTVVDGSSRWVKSYGAYNPGGPATDSGWVKQ